MIEAILGVVGGVIGAVLALIGVRYTARQSAKAAATAAKVSDRQVDVEEYKTIVGTVVEALRDEVSRLTERVEALEARKEADALLIETQKHELEARTVRYVTLARFTRELLAWIEDHFPDASPPPVPATLAADLEGPVA